MAQKKPTVKAPRKITAKDMEENNVLAVRIFIITHAALQRQGYANRDKISRMRAYNLVNAKTPIFRGVFNNVVREIYAAIDLKLPLV